MEEAVSPRSGLLGPLGQTGAVKHKSPVQLSHLNTGKQHHTVEQVEEGSSGESPLERQDSGEQLIKAGTTLSSSPTFTDGMGGSPPWQPGAHLGKRE